MNVAVHMIAVAVSVILQVVPAAPHSRMMTEQAASPATKAPPRQRTPTAARMSTETVEHLRAAAKQAYSHIFTGIGEYRDGSQRLFIASRRALLANRLAKASEEGGRYVVRPDDTIDVLVVDCGDSDRADLWECRSLYVLNADGRKVPPIDYDAATTAYQNGFGAKWTAREVTALYRVAGLERGFTVVYQSVAGIEFERKVTADEARQDLLLVLPWSRP